MTLEERCTIAEAARAALASQLRRDPYDPRLMGMALQSFIQTYDVDTAAARPLLERVIGSDRIPVYGRHELQRLGYEIKKLHDADALELVYSRVFSDISVGDGMVALGSSSVAIGQMQQDARQTLDLCRYALAERFETLLAEHPRSGVRVLAGVIEWMLRQRRLTPRRPYTVELADGVRVPLQHDACNLLEGGPFRHDDWQKMLEAFEERVRMTLDAGDLTFVEAAVDELTRHTRATMLWRVLLRNASRCAKAAKLFLPMVTDPSVLDSREFGEVICDFIEGGFEILDDGGRSALRAAFLQYLNDASSESVRQRRNARVAEWAAVLPADALRSDDPLRALLPARPDSDSDKVDAAERRALALTGTYMSTPSFSPVPITVGVTKAGAAPEIISAITALDPYIRQQPHRVATLGRPAMDVIRQLDELSRPSDIQVRKATLDIMTVVIHGALEERVTFAPEEQLDLELLAVEASKTPPYPMSEEERAQQEEQFAHHPSWGSTARVNAIAILWYLYELGHRLETLDFIQTMADDVEPAVRMHVVQYAYVAAASAPDRAWAIVDRGFHDANSGVWTAALGSAITMQSLDRARVHAMVLDAYDRVLFCEDQQELRLDMVRWLLELCTMFGNSDALTRLERLLKYPSDAEPMAMTLAFELPNETALHNSIERRQWAATKLLQWINTLAARVTMHLTAHGGNVDTYPPDAMRETRVDLKLLHEIAQRMYYASGVLQRSPSTNTFEETGSLDRESYYLLRPMLAALGDIPFASTAYNVLQTLSGAVEVDPRDVLLLACHTLKRGIDAGLAVDPLAEDHVRNFIMRYVFEHRGLLESDRGCLAAVMNVVDSFVTAGWPKWQDVVRALDSIYRTS